MGGSFFYSLLIMDDSLEGCMEALFGLGVGALIVIVIGIPLGLWFIGFTAIGADEVGVLV